MLYLICYDVSKSRHRRNLANLLLDHGTRVQKSAFECEFKTHAKLGAFLTKARQHINPDTDTLRVYRVCGSCRVEVVAVGLDFAQPVLPTIII